MRRRSGPGFAAGSLAASVLGLLLLVATPAAAERVAVRVGEHAGRGRVVFDWPERTGYRVEESRGRVVLHFDRPADFAIPGRFPRNVLDISAGEGGVTVLLRPGARLRHFRLGERVVLDLTDPERPTPVPATPVPVDAAAGPSPADATVPAEPPRVAHAEPPPARAGRGRRPTVNPPGNVAEAVPRAQGAPPAAPAPAAPAPTPAVPRTASATAATPATATAEPAAAPVLPPRGAVVVRIASSPGRGRALSLRLPEGTGLAILRRGDALLAVLDNPVPLDLTALRGDPVLGAADALHLPEATVLRLRLAAPAVLVPRREGDTWLLEAAREVPPGRSIFPEADRDVLTLRAARPGRVVVLEDPETGLPLLVGTVGEAEQSSPQPRRLPRAELLPTILGTALLARGDGVAMRAGAERFVLEGAGAGAPTTPGPAPEAMAMTRLLQLPALATTAAGERLRAQQAGLAGVPPLQRASLRLEAAESLLALGLPQEAQAMLRLAFQEDPGIGADPRARVLRAAAALVAGRVAEAAALDEPALPRTDETALWRAALSAARGEPVRAAQGFAATLPLLLSYPEPLRARLLPPAAEALVEGGENAAARRLIEGAGTLPGLDYARGRLAEAEGRNTDALAAYEEASRGRDRLLRARALRRSVEVRLASGALDAAGAAAALEATLFAWRGDAEELDARTRLSALRRQAGDARGALAMLGETAALFPERAAALRPAMTGALLGALENEAPLAAVSLAEAHRELLPRDAQGQAAMLLLADRLAALDLPDRAAAVLEGALAGMSGEPRAALGARLAALRLGEGDAAGAAAALSGSEMPGLPAPLLEERAVLAALAMARRGQEEPAIAALRGLGPAGLPALADLLAGRRDWAGASEAMVAQAAGPGEIDDAKRRAMVRAVAFSALAGDGSRLSALRAQWETRLGEGPLRDAFLTLTADPVRGLADLPRLQRELNLFRGFSGRLEALRAEAPPTR